MKILVGLTALSPGWEQLLRREGVPYALADLSCADLAGEFSVLAVSRTLSGQEAEAVEAYLRRGGAVLAPAATLQAIPAFSARPERLTYLLAEAEWAGVGLLDLHLRGMIPREANAMRTEQDVPALFAGPWKGGHAVLLPFDPGAALCDGRAAVRCFPDRGERLPAERVSVVGKAALHHLFHGCLRLLHHARGLPYAHLWYFPGRRRNIFAFRIDTDGAPARDIEDLHRLAGDHGVPLTWFLHVRAHETWLDRFARMGGQEIGVHCHEHVPLGDGGVARRDLSTALRLMERAGLRQGGCAAPYGIWSPALAAVVDDLGFAYASEFSYAYDTVPLHAEIPARRFRALQIPIHPIGVGSLRRAGYSAERMAAYFDRVTARKLALGEPLFFYHHPGQREDRVIGALFRRVRDLAVDPTVFGEYAAWWKERERHLPAIGTDGADLVVRSHGPSPEHFGLRVCLPDGRTALVPQQPRIRRDDVRWEEPAPVEVPGDLRRTREFDLRSFLGGVYAALQRRFR